jgi:branched-chain amino acid transport system substrate-binding protein
MLLAAAFAIAGCGSSGTKSSSTTAGSGTTPGTGSSATSASTAAATGATLNVGEVCTCSAGAAGTTHDVPNAVTAWAAYVNSHGGVNGHPVKIYYEDDVDDPAKSITEVHQMVSGDHVVALLDASSQDASWVSYVTAQKVPVISLNQAADGFQFISQPDFFANGTTVITILWGQLKAASEAGAKTYGFVYCTEAPACAQAAPATKALAPSIPIQVTYVAKASNSQPDYTAVCLGAKQAPAAALFPAGVAPNRVADDCARQGYKPVWITSQGTINANDIQDPNLSTATGDLQDFPWMLNTSPAQRLFHQVEDPVLAKAQSAANVDFAYVGGILFQTAAAAGITASNNSPSAQDILNGLYTIKNNTLDGLAPALTFLPGKPNPVTCVFLYGVENGKYAATHGDQTFCQTA